MKKIIWKISLRNLLRHRGKSIIIGLILFIGSLIMTMGNAMVNGEKKNIDKNMVHGMTGDLIIVSTNQIQDNVFSGMPRTMKVLGNYKSVEKFLKSQKEVDDFMPATYGIAMILGGEGHPMGVAFMGVNFKAYQKFFPGNIKIIEGRKLAPDEKGILLNNASRESFYTRLGFWPIPKGGHIVVSNLQGDALSNKGHLSVTNSMVIMGLADSDSFRDIRLPIRGIFEYKELNKALQQINLMDIESFRDAFGLVTSADKEAKVSKDVKKTLSLDTENLDNMFSDTSLETSVNTGNVGLSEGSLKVKENKKVKKKTDWKKGNFHFISVKLKKGVNRRAYLIKLNKELKKARLDARAISWDKAVGFIGAMNIFLSTVLGILVLFVFFVAAIIIMNTLTMNAIERTNEIGMMRAVGAQKKDIGNMFLAETMILAGFFGTLGILSGMLISAIVGSMHIPAANSIVQLFYGGDTLMPLVNVGTFIQGIITLLIVTYLAILYPRHVAKNITPLEAISRE